MIEVNYIALFIGVFLGTGIYNLFLEKPFKKWLQKKFDRRIK